MSEPCDECSMLWQPMPVEEQLRALIEELVEVLWEYAGNSRYCEDTIELLYRAEEEYE